MKASELEKKIEYVRTGIDELDSLLGGGIALGCITEFFGVSSVGKSTLALQVIAQAQRDGRNCLFADTEYSFTPQFASSLGVDCSKLDVTQLRLGEDTFDAIEGWVKHEKGALIVLDSMGGILPREEAEKSSEGKTIGLQSRLMAAFCRKIIGLLSENNCALIVVNHEVVNLNTGAIQSSGGAKLSYHKRYSIRMRPMFGKSASRSTDGSKRIKPIEAELRKEKGMDTKEGRKIELTYEKGRGFVNQEDATKPKRGRPAKVVV